jgi:pyruvate dehydrogenase (quinone)
MAENDVPNASDIVIDTLIAWKVDTIFGLPGDGINGIIEALRTRQDKIKFIQVRQKSRRLSWRRPTQSGPVG